MNLIEQIGQDTIAAMKESDKFKLSVLRMLKSALQLEKINKKHDLSDEETIAVIKKQVKLRKDSIEEFTKYNRTESIANLENEINILTHYLPEELPLEQIHQILDEIFAEINPAGSQDMGKIMKIATERFAGRADLKQVSSLVREKLNQ